MDHFTDVAIEYQAIAKPALAAKPTMAVFIIVGTTERIVYSSARKSATFSEIGKRTDPISSGRVVPFTVPFARATRRVLPKTEDVPFYGIDKMPSAAIARLKDAYGMVLPTQEQPMITEAEFVMAKSFDRTLDRVVGQADGIIAGKNAELDAAMRIIARMKRDLADANARSAAAEAKTASLLRQIQATLN